MRCHLAALAFNCPGDYLSIIALGLGKQPGYFTRKYVEIQHNVWNKAQQKQKSSANIRFRTKIRSYNEADDDYGNVDELSEEEITTRTNELITLLKKNEMERKTLEEETRGQHYNPHWSQERANRITASNFGKICKRRTNTPAHKLINSLLYKPFSGNKATMYGRENEEVALKYFEETTQLRASACGIYIGGEEEFFLGATPDGIINGEDALLEIKCPFVSRAISIGEGVQLKKIKYLECVDNILKLKRNHDYYYQIQGQLQLANKNKCYFLVWSPVGTPHIEIIERDCEFWNTKMYPKLKTFFL